MTLWRFSKWLLHAQAGPASDAGTGEECSRLELGLFLAVACAPSVVLRLLNHRTTLVVDL